MRVSLLAKVASAVGVIVIAVGYQAWQWLWSNQEGGGNGSDGVADDASKDEELTSSGKPADGPVGQPSPCKLRGTAMDEPAAQAAPAQPQAGKTAGLETVEPLAPAAGSRPDLQVERDASGAEASEEPSATPGVRAPAAHHDMPPPAPQPPAPLQSMSPSSGASHSKSGNLPPTPTGPLAGPRWQVGSTHDPLRRCQTERWVSRQSLNLPRLDVATAGLHPFQQPQIAPGSPCGAAHAVQAFVHPGPTGPPGAPPQHGEPPLPSTVAAAAAAAAAAHGLPGRSPAARKRTVSAPEDASQDSHPGASPLHSPGGARSSPGAHLVGGSTVRLGPGGLLGAAGVGRSPVWSPGEPGHPRISPFPQNEYDCFLANGLEADPMLEPAPTEEGYYLTGNVEKALQQLREDVPAAVPFRRYSRSFSEPNLARLTFQVADPRERRCDEEGPYEEEEAASPLSPLPSEGASGPAGSTPNSPLGAGALGDPLGDDRPCSSNPADLRRPPIGTLLRLPGSGEAAGLYPAATQLAAQRLEGVPEPAFDAESVDAAGPSADRAGQEGLAAAARPWPSLDMGFASDSDIALRPMSATGLVTGAADGSHQGSDAVAACARDNLGVEPGPHPASAVASSSSGGEPSIGAPDSHFSSVAPSEPATGRESNALGSRADRVPCDAVSAALDSYSGVPDTFSAAFDSFLAAGPRLSAGGRPSVRRGDESVRGHQANPFFGEARPAPPEPATSARCASAIVTGRRLSASKADGEPSMPSAPSAPSGRALGHQASMRRGDESVRGHQANPFFGAAPRPSMVAEAPSGEQPSGAHSGGQLSGSDISQLFTAYAHMATEDGEAFSPLPTPFESDDAQAHSLSFGASLQRTRDALPNPFAAFGTDEASGSGSGSQRIASFGSSPYSNGRPANGSGGGPTSASTSSFATGNSFFATTPSGGAFPSSLGPSADGALLLGDARASVADSVITARNSYTTLNLARDGPLAGSGVLSGGGSTEARGLDAPAPKRPRGSGGEKDEPEGGGPPPVPLRLEVTAGPLAGTSFTAKDGEREVNVGRLASNTLAVADKEVSGYHAVVLWAPKERTWKVADVGSLNGTKLNDQIISTSNRRRGREYRVNSGDALHLGAHTTLKVVFLEREAAPVGGLPPLHPPAVNTAAPSPPGPTGGNMWSLPTLKGAALLALAAPEAEPEPGAGFAAPGLRLEAWAAGRVGREHARMGQGSEDTFAAHPEVIGAPEGHPTALFCVFDGHCGRGAADQAAAALPEELGKRLGGLVSGAGPGTAAWEAAFAAADARITAEEGTTATALLAWRSPKGDTCLQAANVGDSAALYFPLGRGRGYGEPVALSGDHRFSNAAERQRLADEGLRMKASATRLYGLNISRCLGDKFLKVNHLGLSGAPHVSPVVRVAPGTAGAVVIASDGLWDVASRDIAVQVALQAHAQGGGTAQAIAEALLSHAVAHRTKDDVTVLAVLIRPQSAGSGASDGSGGSRVQASSGSAESSGASAGEGSNNGHAAEAAAPGAALRAGGEPGSSSRPPLELSAARALRLKVRHKRTASTGA